MTAIRPPVWPTAAPPARPAGEGRAAAQKAFFQAALAKAEPAAAPAVHAQAVRAEAIPPQQPAKILRPGSLLDIKV